MKKLTRNIVYSIGCLITIGITYFIYQYNKRVKKTPMIEEYEEKLVG